MRGDGVVEVGVGVDDDAVLAAHLGDDALEVAAGRAARRRRGAMISRPTAPRAGEGDRAHARVADQRGADVALAGQQRERVGGHARPRAARGRARSAQPGDCSAGLRTAVLPVASAAAAMPQRDRQREVPRRDDRADAARRRSAARCARRAPGAAAGRAPAARSRRGRSTRGSRSPRRRRRRPPPTAWRTRGRRARRARRGARAGWPRRATSDPRARSATGVVGPARGTRLRRPRPRVAASSGVAVAASGDDAVGLAGVGRDELLALAAVVADPHRHADGQRRVERGAARRAAPARAGARRSSRTGSLTKAARHGAASSSSSGRPRGLRRARKDSLLVFSSSRRTR